MIISADPSEGDADDGPSPEADGEVRAFEVAADQDGWRLDHLLVATVAEFSRSYLQQLLVAGGVQVNGRVVLKPAARVRHGDQGSIALRPTPQSSAFIAQPMDLRIVHEDADLVIVDKPAGLVVHPAAGNWSGTLLNGLLAWDPALAALPRAGIVHRLDKDTSGLMLIARSRRAMDCLIDMIARRVVQRQYLALAHRPWTGPRQRDVSAAIGRDPTHRLRMAALDPTRHAAKAARTTIECLDSVPAGCLVRCTLHTGRTHQIRVHMQSIGHPLASDPTYGGALVPGIARQALHAYRLALPHPIDGRAIDQRSQLPEDFEKALGTWGLQYNSG